MTAIIIVSFGRIALMERTLTSLFNSGFDNEKTSITVIDNNSQPDIISALVKYKHVIDNLVLLQKNRGKPYAWNLGARITQEQCIISNIESPDYFLFCDNDLDFKLGWQKKMIDTYEEHKNLPLCGLSGMAWPSHKTRGTVQGVHNKINIVRFPPGCCILMSADAYRSNGPWDTRRLIRTVDTSYFRNAINRGYSNASIHPQTVINHTGRQARTWDIKDGKPKLLP